MKNTLSPKELASAIGVSESSLKRWADDGRLAVNRTVGGHRRISLQEAIRFAREANLPVLRPEVLGLPELAAARAARGQKSGDATALLTEKLLQGYTDEARAIILELYLAGKSVAFLCDHTIRHAMAEIGKLYRHREDGILIEHRATDACIQSLNVLRHLIERPTQPPTDTQDRDPNASPPDAPPIAVGGAPAGDPYLLASIMATVVLADLGYKSVNLGPDTPIRTLALTIDTYLPRLVWLSCSVPESMPAASALTTLCDRAAAIDAQVVLGGRGLGNAPSVSNLHVFDTMTEFGSFARGVLAARGQRHPDPTDHAHADPTGPDRADAAIDRAG